MSIIMVTCNKCGHMREVPRADALAGKMGHCGRCTSISTVTCSTCGYVREAFTADLRAGEWGTCPRCDERKRREQADAA